MKRIKWVFFLAAALLVTGLNPAGQASDQKPVVKLIQAKGKVWYSTGGEKWKPVTRNKYLYEGWKVKTGENAGCKLLYQDSEKVETLLPLTEARVQSGGIQVARGTATSGDSAASLPGHLKRKLAKIQKYTTVQRSGNSQDRFNHQTARWLVLNERYPELAWANAGEEYTYRLFIGDDSVEVNGSSEPVIRHRVAEIRPGEYPYFVQVLYEEEVYFTPGQKGRLVWMDKKEEKALEDKIRRLGAKAGGPELGNLLDETGLKVAAMDQYRTFLKAHPDANEIRPFLVKVLHELGLSGLREQEALLYKRNAGN